MARPPKLDSSKLWLSRLADLIICHGVFALRGARRSGQDENKPKAETKRIFIPRFILRTIVWQEKRPLPADRASGVPHFPFRQELFIPPMITIEEMTGFSLFALKAVLSGWTRGPRPLHHTTLRNRRSNGTLICPKQPRQLERHMGPNAMEQYAVGSHSVARSRRSQQP